VPIPAPLAKLLIRTGLVGLHPGVRRLLGDGLPFLKYYSSRVLESPNEEVKRTQQLVSAEGSRLDLSLGAPPILPSLANLRFAAESGYPSATGLPELRSAYADKLRKRNDLAVDPDRELFVCNGVSQAIGLFLDAFLDPGDRVALFDPGYFMYRLAVQQRRLRRARIPHRGDAGSAVLNERDLQRGLRGAKALLLNTPNNPTGAVFAPELLERIAYWCRRYDLLVFADEVYEDFQYAGAWRSFATFAGVADRTVTAHSFSKSYGLAGSRVGVVSGNRHLLQPMLVTYLASAPFVSLPAQRLALAALNVPLAELADRRRIFAERRTWLTGELRRMGFEAAEPGGAFFCWARLPEHAPPAWNCAEMLRDRAGVLAMPGESLATDGARYLRFSFTEDLDVLVEAVRRMEPVLRESLRTNPAEHTRSVRRAA
jgi:aspartate/methionine/tyrosine aminotransferase